MIKTIFRSELFRCLGPAQSQPHQIACGKASKLACSRRHRTSGLSSARAENLSGQRAVVECTQRSARTHLDARSPNVYCAMLRADKAVRLD